MKLNEKILYCRKRAGLSQEALAERIGVSRQAVSKWETGDAEPEISKLRLLAAEFGVTADWLLSEEEPQGAREYTEEKTEEQSDDWLSSVPGMLGRLARRFGWLAGVYVSVMGAGALIFGLIVRFVITLPLRSIANDPLWAVDIDMMMKNNPIVTVGNIFIIAGVLVIIAGIALAVFLKKKLNK